MGRMHQYKSRKIDFKASFLDVVGMLVYLSLNTLPM